MRSILNHLRVSVAYTDMPKRTGIRVYCGKLKERASEPLERFLRSAIKLRLLNNRSPSALEMSSIPLTDVELPHVDSMSLATYADLFHNNDVVVANARNGKTMLFGAGALTRMESMASLAYVLRKLFDHADTYTNLRITNSSHLSTMMENNVKDSTMFAAYQLKTVELVEIERITETSFAVRVPSLWTERVFSVNVVSNARGGAIKVNSNVTMNTLWDYFNHAGLMAGVQTTYEVNNGP